MGQVAVRWQRRSRGERDQGRAGAKLHVHMITLLHIDSATGASLSVHLRLRAVPIAIIPPLRVANSWPASFAHTKYAHTMRQEQLRSNPDDQWRPLDANITSAARPEESLSSATYCSVSWPSSTVSSVTCWRRFLGGQCELRDKLRAACKHSRQKKRTGRGASEHLENPRIQTNVEGADTLYSDSRKE